MRDVPRLVAVAFGFLTRLPVPAVGRRVDDLPRAAPLFPLVGVVVGGVAALLYAGASALLPPTPAAVIAVAVAVALTGALHEDGLADVADGFVGGHTPARRREIMRDSRIGTFGGTALVLSLLLRVSLVASLSPSDAAAALLTGHVLGRGAVLLAVARSHPAEGTSSSALVAGRVGPAGLVVGAVLTLVPVALAAGSVAWLPVLVAVVAVLASVGLAERRVGGLTGDVLGATTQVAHLAGMATVVALVQAGHL